MSCCLKVKRVYLIFPAVSEIFPPMNESHRIAYLNAMGIDQYYPRRELPRAKPSPHFEFDAEPEPTSPLPAAATKLQAKAKASSRLQALKDEPAPVEPVPNIPAPPRRTSTRKIATESTAAAKLSFVLDYYAINNVLAVLVDRPPQIAREQQQQAAELLQGILRAVLPVAPADLPRPENFSWPLLATMAGDRSEQSAARALHGFIRSKQERDGFANLVVFSEQLGPLLQQAQAAAADFPATFTGRELRLTLCHSLSSMLALPEMKRETWQGLQALRGRLQDGSNQAAE